MIQGKIFLENLKMLLLILSVLVISENGTFAQQKYKKKKTEEIRKLCLTMSCDDYEKVDLLIMKGADYHIFYGIDGYSQNLLFVASYNGCAEIVRLLLNANVDVNASSTYSLKEPKLIVDNRIEVDDGSLAFIKSTKGIYELDFTPLYIASQEGFLEIVKLLVNSGADINKGLSHETLPGYDVYINKTPLFIAAYKGHTEIVDFLIAFHADVDAITKEDELSIIHIASQVGHTDIVKLLLDADVVIDTRTKDNQSPLYVASKNGYRDIVKLLIKAGADVNAPCTESLSTPLYIASKYEHVEIAKILLEANADVNKPESSGATPLMISVILGNIELTETLIDAEANIFAEIHYEGEVITPLLLAEYLGHTDIVQLLQNAASGELVDNNKEFFQEVQIALNTTKPLQLVEFHKGDYAKNILIKSPGSKLEYTGGSILNGDGFAYAKIPSKGDVWQWITNDDFLILKISDIPKQADDIIAYHNETNIPIGFVYNRSKELTIIFPKEITPCSFKIIGVFEDKLIIHEKE